MIEQKTIAEIFETAKIDEVVGDFVNLRRRGVNMIGLCPFHNEKTPSFTVSPAKGIYKCFGCGKGGDSIGFIMEHEKLSYPEALMFLARKYKIKVEETEQTEEEEIEQKLQGSLFILNDFAVKYFQKNLHNTDIGKSVGLSYFKQRGFRLDIIKKFKLGFALNEKDTLTSTMVSRGYNIELIKLVGLSKNGRDFFRNRVLFPIHNLSGKVIGFGGRILVTDKKQPKYLNTPESEIYNKSKVLYGIYFAKKAIRQEDNCFLVEGYTDVISLHQAGIENVVASSGTSLTVGQIQLIKRYTPNITILYDGDPAGIKAALRGLDLVLEQDMNVKVVLLPEGEDPDSFVQSVGTEEFKTYIAKNAVDFILFKTNLLLKETEDNNPIKKSLVVTDLTKTISKIKNPTKRDMYVKQLSSLLDVEEKRLFFEVNKGIRANLKEFQIEKERKKRQKELSETTTPEETLPSDKSILNPTHKIFTYNDEFQEQDIVRILMLFGDQTFTITKAKEAEEWQVAVYVLSNMEEILDEFENPLYKKIVNMIYENLAEEKFFSHQDFLNHEDSEIQTLAINLSTSPYEYSENWINRFGKPLSTQPMPDKNFKVDAIKGVNIFKLKKIQRVYEQNQRRLKDVAKEDFEELMRLLKVQKKLMEIRNELAELTGTVVLR